jgi:hypothetical protein
MDASGFLCFRNERSLNPGEKSGSQIEAIGLWQTGSSHIELLFTICASSSQL